MLDETISSESVSAEESLFSETTYDLADGELSAVEIGDAQSAETTIVFLHGWLDNAASFYSVMEAFHALAPQYHLCAIDLPGHGMSSNKLGSNFYLFHDYIDDIYQLMPNFSPNKRILVGHSLGALISACYSAAFPEQVSGLVQIEGYAPLSEAPEECVTRLREGVISRHQYRSVPARGYDCVKTAVRHRAQVNKIAPALISPVIERGIKQVGDLWYWRSDGKLKCDALYRLSPMHAKQIMEQVTCPQRVIIGDEGFPYLPQQCRELTENPPEVFTIEGGHHCHLEQPEQVAELILGLVNQTQQ
ncbi:MULTISPECIES: alpha/beta fold hydrolase [Vibrio]|uniref:Alpha/beta fold hydrolase n=2 Tax=Vibrio TaxID=662 RepID=A0A7X4LK60_9VIBR|nr:MULTISPECIES: alpha/beta hydrolase [Vibrio]MBF8999913.1 alpha/beta hydrolase [Vibrio nitrifigilis]MZI93483.1 alpha/beta fold hydrolase [Vibrio eleionomae]